MFDIKRSFDRRQVFSVIVIILAVSCIPTLMVVFAHLAGRMFPGILIGIALYYFFLRKNNGTNS